MKSILPILLCSFFFSIHAGAQGYMTLTGKIIDKSTKKPVAYAHIGIPDKGIGTTSGHDGAFRFKVPRIYSESTMTVSFIGYTTFRKKVSDLDNPSTIYIEQTATDLIEIVVMDESGVEDIIRKAVRNIPKNYTTYPTTMLGFYRESRTDDSLRYTYLAEGVLNIHKGSYRSQKEGQVSLVQGRKINLKNPLDTVVRSSFSSGHMAGHRFDFVKNKEDFIDERYFPAYKYWVEAITFYNDRPVYIIGFDKDPKGTPAEITTKKSGGGLFNRLINRKKKVKATGRMRGRIFIDKESFAFVRAEFEIREDGLNKYNDYPLYAGSWKGNSYVVNYRQVGEKWFFGDAIREGEYGGGGKYINEIKITEINTERAEALPYLDRLRRGERFVKMTGTYDEDFWVDYNTTPLNEGLVESVQQYKNAIKAQEVFDTEYMADLQKKRDSIATVKMLERKEQMAVESGKSMEEIEFEMELEEVAKLQKIKRKFDRLKFSVGVTGHYLPTETAPLNIRYADEAGENILEVNNEITKRDYEIAANFDLDIFWHKNFYTRIGIAKDFYNSIYRERTIGFGTQLNLSKQRPFYIKALAQYSHLRYARKVDNANTDYGKFKVDGKKFNANSLRINYGSRLHNLKFTGEFAIELNPSQELFIRGNYYYNFAHKQDVWFKERKKVFPDRKRLSATDSQLEVLQNDQPFDERITPETSFSITVGLLFK